VTARDGAALLLATAIRLLPPARRDWGRAMGAELAGLTTRRERWSFALGCAATVLRQPLVLRWLAYAVLMAGGVVGIVAWSSDIAYAPLRWALVALVGALIAVSWLGRVSSPLGPVSGGRTARVVRGAGSLMVAVAALGVFAEIGRHDRPVQQAQAVVPILAAILACYLVGFVAVTADRSVASSRMLQTATGAGVGGALLWLGLVVLFPPIPTSIRTAVVVLVAAMGIAAAVTREQLSRRVLVALTAGTVLTLLLLIELVLLSSYAPAGLIPDLAPAALTPADDLAQSRIEIQDPYVALLLIGSVVPLALGIASVALRRRETGASPVAEI
jgi:hypothetical protein